MRIKGGLNTKIIGDRIEHNKALYDTREKEEEKLGEERRERRKYHMEITEMISKGFPDEEIVIAIQRKFPEKGEKRIIRDIQHWRSQYKDMKQKIDNLVRKVQTGEDLRRNADNDKLPIIKRRYSIFSDEAQAYYESRMSEIGDEAR